MKVSEIITHVKTLSEDQSIADATVLTWLNLGINRINLAVNGNISPVVLAPDNPPDFDARYHESLVLYGVVKYKESDSAFADAQYFQQQFEIMLTEMQRDLNLRPSQWMDNNIQQIVVASSSVKTYNLVMSEGSQYGTIRVYQNDTEIYDWTTKFTTEPNTITIGGTITLAVNDKLTIKWEDHSEFTAPPYEHWREW